MEERFCSNYKEIIRLVESKLYKSFFKFLKQTETYMGRNNEQYRNRLSHDRISFVWKFVLVLREIITVLVQGNGVKTEYKFVSDDNSYIIFFLGGRLFRNTIILQSK